MEKLVEVDAAGVVEVGEPEHGLELKVVVLLTGLRPRGCEAAGRAV
jgi:hypothetical protein